MRLGTKIELRLYFLLFVGRNEVLPYVGDRGNFSEERRDNGNGLGAKVENDVSTSLLVGLVTAICDGIRSGFGVRC